jgi:hypothetical protein
MASGETMLNIRVVGGPTTIAANHRPVEQGQTPSSVGHHCRSGGYLLSAGACLGLLLVVTPVFAC